MELVCQQSRVIKKYGNFSVIPLFGDVGVDFFKQEQWSYIEEQFQVRYLKYFCNNIILCRNYKLLFVGFSHDLPSVPKCCGSWILVFEECKLADI